MSLAAACRARILSSRGGIELSVDMLGMSLCRSNVRSNASTRTESRSHFVKYPLETGVVVSISCQRYLAGGCYSGVVHVGEAKQGTVAVLEGVMRAKLVDGQAAIAVMQ
jgi:hypothetical protein